MARIAKTLESQLKSTLEDLRKAEDKVTSIKHKISEIERQIENRDMRNAYALIKKKNISLEELENILFSKEKVKK